MSFFDILFPEQAQAIHLRTLAEQAQLQSREAYREQSSSSRAQAAANFESTNVDKRIVSLERDLGKASLVIEALLEMLEAKGVFTREEIAARISDVDARDGSVDGRIKSSSPIKPNRPWPGDAGTA
jgi:3-hydroxyacyl-CoA dehydrogenase